MNANLCRRVAASICFLPLAAGASDWPQWRGPTRTGHAGLDAPAPATLPKELKPVWKIAAGSGHSSPVVARGQLLFLEFKEGQEVARLLDAATGKDLWQTPFSEAFEDEWGAGPRSTPILDGDRAYVQSCRGEFRCLNVADGKVLWGTSYEKDFGVKFLGSKANEGTASRRGNNGSGVIDGDRVVLPVGAYGSSLVCFDKTTGKVLWKAGADEAGYSSFVMATLGGVKQVVAFTADALLGADLKDGKILWRVPFKTNAKRHAASPVVIGDTVVVNSHTIGLVATRVTREGASWKTEPAWANTDLKINLATPVVVEGALYCQGPNRDYICADAGTGKLNWSKTGFGLGKKDYSSTIALGSRLLVLTEDGTLLLLDANPQKYTELGRLQVCGNTWAHPAYADGRLYVRDGRSLACLNLGSSLAAK